MDTHPHQTLAQRVILHTMTREGKTFSGGKRAPEVLLTSRLGRFCTIHLCSKHSPKLLRETDPRSLVLEI